MRKLMVYWSEGTPRAKRAHRILALVPVLGQLEPECGPALGNNFLPLLHFVYVPHPNEHVDPKRKRRGLRVKERNMNRLVREGAKQWH